MKYNSDNTIFVAFSMQILKEAAATELAVVFTDTG